MTIAEIESVFQLDPIIGPDLTHSDREARQRAVGPTMSGRTAFVVFTVRLKRGVQHFRPISARYMHLKERQTYARYRQG